MNSSSTGPLLPLVNQLKDCPAVSEQVTTKQLVATWNSFRTINLEQGDTVTPAVIAGVILYDTGTFAPLLTVAEQGQFAALARTALERYQQLTNPPNPIGKLIAAALKESI